MLHQSYLSVAHFISAVIFEIKCNAYMYIYAAYRHPISVK